jgi:hypothetical protein
VPKTRSRTLCELPVVSHGTSRIRVGPAAIPSHESPEVAVRLLVERGYDACEIDFGGGFWMDWDYAECLGVLARRQARAETRLLGREREQASPAAVIAESPDEAANQTIRTVRQRAPTGTCHP